VPSLFNKTVAVLSGMLDYRAKRHQVLTSNIANLDVADYRAADVALRGEGSGKAAPLSPRTTHPRHLPFTGVKGEEAVATEVEVSPDRPVLDEQMARLSENHLMYNAAIEMLARKFRTINAVLKEGK